MILLLGCWGSDTMSFDLILFALDLVIPKNI